MDLKQIENIIAIADLKSISKAAKKLFITQSALNQQLLKLEKELGVKLFERHYHEMTPTFAGQIYIKNGREMLRFKEETYKIIKDIGSENAGEISLAYTPEQGSRIFSYVYPVFHKEYPNYRIKTFEARIPQMKELIRHKDVTFGMLAYPEGQKPEPEFDHIAFGKERIVLILPSSHPIAKEAGQGSYRTLPVIDIRRLKDDEFILSSGITMMRSMIDGLFQINEVTPKILIESASSTTILRMASNQMGPAFVPENYVNPALPLAYFRTNPEMSWKHSLTFLKGTYISKAEKRLIELLKQFSQPGSIDISNF